MRTRPRRFLRALRRLTWRFGGSTGLVALLCGISVLLSVLRLVGAERFSPLAAQIGPLVAGALLLSAYRMRWLILIVAAGVGADLAALGLGRNLIPPLIGIVVAAALGYEVARRRSRLGMSGIRSDAMLVELRDRLRAQGEIPQLPPGWHVEVSLRSAGGVAFAGDFVVSSLGTEPGPHLELALVDVSGKGVAAGTRALQLSGALGGLLGAVSPELFLTEANRYLLRQPWPEGFATAVHLTLDLGRGSYVLESAGHPPAVHYDAGSGRWEVSPSAGPLLGVMDDVAYVRDGGVLRPGDALLLYTDGLVEMPGRDIEDGIDRLLGAAERLVPRGGFGGSAARLVDEVVADAGDDTALVLVWRE